MIKTLLFRSSDVSFSNTYKYYSKTFELTPHDRRFFITDVGFSAVGYDFSNTQPINLYIRGRIDSANWDIFGKTYDFNQGVPNFPNRIYAWQYFSWEWKTFHDISEYSDITFYVRSCTNTIQRFQFWGILRDIDNI